MMGHVLGLVVPKPKPMGRCRAKPALQPLQPSATALPSCFRPLSVLVAHRPARGPDRAASCPSNAWNRVLRLLSDKLDDSKPCLPCRWQRAGSLPCPSSLTHAPNTSTGVLKLQRLDIQVIWGGSRKLQGLTVANWPTGGRWRLPLAPPPPGLLDQRHTQWYAEAAF